MGQLGGILSALGVVLEVLERSWGHLGWNLGHLGDVLGPSWGVLGVSWRVLGRPWRLPGAILEVFLKDFLAS